MLDYVIHSLKYDCNIKSRKFRELNKIIFNVFYIDLVISQTDYNLTLNIGSSLAC